MSLLNFGKGSSQKPVAHANTPVEVQPRAQRVKEDYPPPSILQQGPASQS